MRLTDELRRRGTLKGEKGINKDNKIVLPTMKLTPELIRRGARDSRYINYDPNFEFHEQQRQDKHGTKIHLSDETKNQQELHRKKTFITNSITSGRLSNEDAAFLLERVEDIGEKDIANKLRNLSNKQLLDIKNAIIDLKNGRPIVEPEGVKPEGAVEGQNEGNNTAVEGQNEGNNTAVEGQNEGNNTAVEGQNEGENATDEKVEKGDYTEKSLDRLNDGKLKGILRNLRISNGTGSTVNSNIGRDTLISAIIEQQNLKKMNDKSLNPPNSLLSINI